MTNFVCFNLIGIRAKRRPSILQPDDRSMWQTIFLLHQLTASTIKIIHPTRAPVEMTIEPRGRHAFKGRLRRRRDRAEPRAIIVTDYI
jgi:hypothetical protein